MAIQVRCGCGRSFDVNDEHAGRKFSCPGCGQPVTAPSPQAGGTPTLQYASLGAQPGGVIGAPSNGLVPPTELEAKHRYPGCPQCHLIFITDGAVVNCDFDASPTLMSVGRGLATGLKKKFDVQIGPPSRPGTPTAYVRIVTIDQGNRMLRYFLGIFFGATTFEIEGNVVGPAGRTVPFHFKARGRFGMFGGDSLALLRLGAKSLGVKVAKSLKNA